MAKLHFYYSAMNAGKSTTLLQSSHNYNERGLDTLLFIPAIDDRAGVGVISTRIGLKQRAHIVQPDTDLFTTIEQMKHNNPRLACILIDEAQFLNQAQVNQLCRVVDHLNLPVLCYGIRSDFQAEPFPGSLYLLTLADELTEIKTICHCGRKASMNMRIDENGKKVSRGSQVEIGGNERYVATCRRHFDLGDAGLDITAADVTTDTTV